MVPKCYGDNVDIYPPAEFIALKAHIYASVTGGTESYGSISAQFLHSPLQMPSSQPMLLTKHFTLKKVIYSS